VANKIKVAIRVIVTIQVAAEEAAIKVSNKTQAAPAVPTTPKQEWEEQEARVQPERVLQGILATATADVY